MHVNVEPIGYIRSGFKEKFGIPRQPGLTQKMISTLELEPSYGHPDTVAGLEGTTHLWIVFHFSATAEQGWKPKVRPPRLGGNEKVGVYATRSPFRPNPIGLSAVKLESIQINNQRVSLLLSGADLLDGTPVLDIKPYLPYSDCIPEAQCAIANAFTPLDLPIKSSDVVKSRLAELGPRGISLLEEISEILRCDPRPAYQRDPSREYGIRLYEFDLRWSIDEDAIRLIDLIPSDQS
jgi:tRNA-Thr(GGU) m(6)t(6)A37 methyltransferase TsaA